MEDSSRPDLALFQTDELVEEILKRVDCGVVITHTQLDGEHAEHRVRTGGPRVYIIGMLIDAATKLKLVLDDFIVGDDECDD